MKILVLPGDGIGPEITTAVVEALTALDGARRLGLHFEDDEIGFASLKRNGITLTDAVVARAKAADGIVLGPVSHHAYPPKEQGGLNPSAEFRKRLDLYANIRPSYGRAGIAGSRADMDLVIVRENTEGFYADRNMAVGSGEFMPTPDVALAVRKVTAMASKRIAEKAFELAMSRKRKVTAVHKANVLKLSDGLFLREVREVASRYPDVTLEDVHVDAMASYLIRSPERYDIVVTTNMFGDILSNEASEFAGGLGLAESLNEGADYAVAQAAHGSAPDIEGQDLANPSALILSAAWLLASLGRRKTRPDLTEASRILRSAVDGLLASTETRTRDVGGKLGTKAFSKALVERLKRAG